MKITKSLIRKIILEEFLNEEKDDQEYHAAAEFFESNYGVSYEDFFEAISKTIHLHKNDTQTY